MTNGAPTRTIVVLLTAGLLAGFAVRLFHLDQQTITHPEFYVPNIPLPDWVDTPRERLTPGAVASFALFGDKHPPGYELLMLAWNKTFGTGLFTMRLTSVLFGILGVCALPWYVRAVGGRDAVGGAGVLGVWLLSLHGFHISWSQQVRPWILTGTLGILTTALLPRLIQRPTTQTVLAYAGLAGLGLWVEYYYWPLFGVQVAWILLHETGRARWTPALQAILLTGTLATPLVIYAWIHMTEQPSHVGRATWSDVLMMLQFGNVLHQGRLTESLSGFAPTVSLLTAGLGVVALVLGMKAWPQPNVPTSEATGVEARRRDRRLGIILVVSAVIVTLGTWLGFARLVGDRRIFKLALVGPTLILGVWRIAPIMWPRVAKALRRLGPFRWLGDVLADPVAVIPVAAFTGLALLSQVAPIFAAYGLVVFTPLFVVIAARGISRIHRLRAPFTAAVLGVFAYSVYLYGTSSISAREYKGLALQMMPRMKLGDTVVTHDAWYAVPIMYYLKPDLYRVRPPPKTDAEQEALPDTLWVVGYGRANTIEADIADIVEALPGYSEVERVSTPTSAAGRFVRTQAR